MKKIQPLAVFFAPFASLPRVLFASGHTDILQKTGAYAVLLLSFLLFVIVYLAFRKYLFATKAFSLFDRIVRNSSDLIFTIDRTGKIIFFNSAFLQATAYKREEIRKKSLNDIVVSADQILKHIVDSADTLRPLHDIEFILTDKQGREHLFQAAITPGEIDKGRPNYTFIARDITEKKKMLTDLIDSEQRFKAISENTADAIFLLSNLKIIYSNPSASQMLGYTQDELARRDFSELLAQEYRSIFLDRYQRRFRGERTAGILRVFLLPRTGPMLQVELSLNTFDYMQQPAEVIIARDMTDKTLLEQQLIQAEKLASLGQLVTGISHELNNKLQPIFIYCQLLKMNPFQDKVLSQLEGIEASAGSAKIILESLLRFGRPGQMMKEKSSINDIVRETLTLIDYKFTPNNIRLISELDPALPLSYFDRNQIGQVLLNILNNAIFAIEETGGTELIVRTYSDKKMIILAIADSGPGIPPGHLDRIFDPFFSTKPVGKGTGLGLSISYSIIKAHNGRIYASNRREGGAVFTIELPILARSSKTEEKKESGDRL